jgi:hypothetical protein
MASERGKKEARRSEELPIYSSPHRSHRGELRCDRAGTAAEE